MFFVENFFLQKKFNPVVHPHPISFYRVSIVIIKCVESLNLGSVAIEALFYDSGGIIGAHPRKEEVLLQIWESLVAV